MNLKFNPTSDQTFELEGEGRYNFVRCKGLVDKLVAEGRYAEACEARYEAFLSLAEALPEDEAMPLSWEHANSRAALSILYKYREYFASGKLEANV